MNRKLRARTLLAVILIVGLLLATVALADGQVSASEPEYTCVLPDVAYLGESTGFGGFASASPSAGILTSASPPQWGNLIYPAAGDRAWLVDLHETGVTLDVQPLTAGWYYVHPTPILPGQTLTFLMLAADEGSIRLYDAITGTDFYSGTFAAAHQVRVTAETTTTLAMHTQPAALLIKAFCVEPKPEPAGSTIPPAPTPTDVPRAETPTGEPAINNTRLFLPLIGQ